MNKENKIYRHYLFIALLLVLSCSPQKKDWSEMTSKEIIKTLINTQIYIPEDLLIYENDELVAFDSISLSGSKFKIITLIYGDCEKCIKSINSWHDLENEIIQKEQLKMYFVILTSNPDFFIERYLPEIGISSSILIDKSYNFLIKNNFPPYKRFHTFLLDRNNEIMLIGTPFYNDKSMQLYKNTIENFK